MSTATIHILYVEPNEAVSTSRSNALEATASEFLVDTVQTTERAVQRCERTAYDAIVSRYDLDSTDGISFLTSVLADRPSMTTILLTDDVTASLLRDAYSSGIDEIVPIDDDSADVSALTNRLHNQFDTARQAKADGPEESSGSEGFAVERPGLEKPARQLESLARTTPDSIVTIDTESVIHFANPAIEDILGYEPEEIIGEPLTQLMSDPLAERHESAFQRYLDTGEQQLDWENIELPAQHKDGSEVPLSISFSELTYDGEHFFTGILRDVSEKKELRAERELLHEVTREIAEASTFEEGVEIALSDVGEAMNWAYGEAWVPDEEGTHLARHTSKYVESNDYLRFYEASESMTFKRNEGLPGRVWESAEPEWMSDVSSEPEAQFVRADEAARVGLQAALGVPITAGGKVVAVVVFAMPEHRESDDGMIQATAGVAASLGRLMLRKQAEQALREERNLKTRILETSPLGIVIIDAQGQFEYVNDAAESILDVSLDDDSDLTYDDLELQTMDERGDPIEDPQRPYRKVLETGESLQQEVQVRRPGGEPRWLSVNGAPLEDETGAVTKTVFAFEDVTERKERERELEQANAMLETARDGVYALDEEGRFIGVNQAYADMVGYPREEILGQPATMITSEQISADVEEIQAELAETDQDVMTYEAVLQTAGGNPLPIEARISLLPLGDGRNGRVGVVRDISARKRREEQLKQLNELAQALTTAETAQEVCEMAVETAHEALELPMTAIERYDDQTGRLAPIARTSEVTELVGDELLFEAERDLPWRVYTEQRERVVNDIESDAELADAETPLESVIVLPIGSYGVFISGATTPDAFSEQDATLANIFVANVEAALDRVEREAQLRERTEELEDRTTTLERVNRINSVIRDLTQLLTQASSREEIEQSVCTLLANSDPYRFVWIGEQNAIGGEIVSRESAGVEQGYLDAITITADESPTGNGPAGRAVETHEPQVQNNLHRDPPFDPWRAEALQRGYRSSISVPLVYMGTLYGVLNLYAATPGVFDELEMTVLEELGQMIGYAINALERKKALVSDRAVELQFQISNADIAAVQFARDEDSLFEFEALVEQADSSLRAFFTVSGSPPERVEEYSRRSTVINDLNLIAEREEGYLYEATVSESSFLASCLQAGAHPTELTATGDGAQLTVELPSTGDIKAFLEMFLQTYDGAELTARRELDRPIRTEQEFQALYEERLTEREEEVLRTAYYAGFFNFPRDSSGSEVAEILDVSQPTVNRHLRKGERKLFDLIFEGDPETNGEQ
ncbi:PAS domain S-box protein [Halorussus halophilus]|uniref:PAS domain S-box protein n=1 Tax=Halorussus halophilus TaxID=2650975 RepID=UPI00130139CE|nr:PAS domain S-box protein [Halorussus halophilus]